MNKYQVKVTANGLTLYIAKSGEFGFTEHQTFAETFDMTLGDFSKYVLDEVENYPFGSHIEVEDESTETLADLGIEKIEFIYISG